MAEPLKCSLCGEYIGHRQPLVYRYMTADGEPKTVNAMEGETVAGQPFELYHPDCYEKVKGPDE
jgi:hypothetical protein